MKVLVFLCLIGVTLAAVFIAPPSTHPDHPGKCWIEDAKAAVAPGESYTKIGNCVSYNCHSDFSYQGEQCGVIGTQPPCKVSGVDNTKLWPECCPKIVC